VTPKDASNLPTQVHQVPRWTFSPSGIAGGVDGKTEFTPTISASGAGTLTAYCEADGIRSNDGRGGWGVFFPSTSTSTCLVHVLVTVYVLVTVPRARASCSCTSGSV
jgi:hypothetical protein